MGAQPTFTLQVTFTGLCMFARADNAGSRWPVTVYLVSPDHRPPARPVMPGHEARVWFDPASLRPAGVPGQAWVSRLLRPGASMPITALQITAPRVLPGTVLDVSTVTGVQLDPACTAESEIGATFVLTGGSFAVGRVDHPFDFDGQHGLWIAREVVWTALGVAGPSLDIPIPGGSVVPLYPISSPAGRTLTLRVKNVLPEEQAADDPPDVSLPVAIQRAMHFAAYYDFFPAATGHEPCPIPAAADGNENIYGSFLTCSVATGHL